MGSIFRSPKWNLGNRSASRESLRDTERVLDGAPRRQRPGFEFFPERHALEKFADQKRGAVMGPDVVDGQNVGVV